MGPIFSKLLDQLNSSVIVLLAILLAAGWMLYKMGGWKQIFTQHTGRIEKVENVGDKVIRIETMVSLIYNLVNPNIPTRAQSPISLTAVGEEIVQQIKAEDIFKTYAVKLISMVNARKPKNAYDIQQVAFEVATKELPVLLNEKETLAIKDQAFKRGLLTDDILRIFGVFLRNKILADQGIPIADVDKHATGV